MMMTTYTVLTGPALQIKITTFEKRLFNVVRQAMEAKAQSWTALFRAFSSHRQPSASLTKLFPSCGVFFIAKLRETNRTQHVTVVFNVNQFLFFN